MNQKARYYDGVWICFCIKWRPQWDPAPSMPIFLFYGLHGSAISHNMHFFLLLMLRSLMFEGHFQGLVDNNSCQMAASQLSYIHPKVVCHYFSNCWWHPRAKCPNRNEWVSLKRFKLYGCRQPSPFLHLPPKKQLHTITYSHNVAAPNNHLQP